MNKLDIYKNQDYILNDAFDQAVVIFISRRSRTDIKRIRSAAVNRETAQPQ